VYFMILAVFSLIEMKIVQTTNDILYLSKLIQP